MFNVSGGELLLIVVLFVLLFGPERVPEVAVQIGKAVRQIRELTDASTTELRRELERAARELEQPPRTGGHAMRLGPIAEGGSPDGDWPAAPAPDDAGATVTTGPPGLPPSDRPEPVPSIFRSPGEPDGPALADPGEQP